MKNVAIIVVLIGLVVYFISSTGSKSADQSNGYNKTTDIKIDGVPFHKAKSDASSDTPPSPPVLNR